MAYRKWYRYEPQLYWVAALLVMCPLFLPYFESEPVYLLLMMRFLVPVVALGLPLLFHMVSRLRLFMGAERFVVYLQIGFLFIMFAGYPVLLPMYSALQEEVHEDFIAADKTGAEYNGGVIVCDIPSMVYRLVQEWDVAPTDVLSNHYGPHYYGIDDPEAYLEWLQTEDIRLWMYYGSRGDPVWKALEAYPGVFVNLFGEPGEGCYRVDSVVLDSVL
jgi:hypothetical protein